LAGTARNRLVGDIIIILVGIFEDDVPSVNETGDIAQ